MPVVELKPGSLEPANVDSATGAPAHVRALVGGMSEPEARLATLRHFYPDAFPDPANPENFIFTDPKTGRLTLYNPAGLDAGDMASLAREGAQFAGGTAGAVAGSPGGIPGAMAGGALGTAGGEEAFNLVAQQFGMEDPRSLGERAAETSVIGLSGGAAGPAGAAAGAGVRAGTRGILRGGQAGREEAAQSIQDLGIYGATPSLAQATKKPWIDAMETFIARTPGGAGRIRKAVDQTNSAVQTAVENRARLVAKQVVLDPEVAGRTIERGIREEGGFIERFTMKASDLFSDLKNHIAPDETVKIDNTARILTDLSDPVPLLPKTSATLASSASKRLATALEEDTALALQDIAGQSKVPFEALLLIRRAVGRQLADKSLIAEYPKAELKQLYRALSEDIRIAAREFGGEQAVRSFERANKYYSAGMKRVDDIVEPAIRNKVPEQIFEALESSSRKGATKIRTLRRSLQPEQWRVVVGATIRRLGRATPGKQMAEGEEFSFETFLTNWNKLDPRSKDALFDNIPGAPGLRPDMDALARAAERIRESSQMFANPPGTGASLIGQAMVMGGIGSVGYGAITGQREFIEFPLIVALSGVGANGIARLMTSPRFVRWIAQGTRIKPAGFASHLGRLGGVAAGADPETREAVIDYARQFKEAAIAGTLKEASGQK